MKTNAFNHAVNPAIVRRDSNIGSSHSLEACAREVSHQRAVAKEVLTLRVRAPHRPTAKGLAQVMLQALGDPAWTVEPLFRKSKRLIALLAARKTRAIVIDELRFAPPDTAQTAPHELEVWLRYLAATARVRLEVGGHDFGPGDLCTGEALKLGSDRRGSE